MHGLINRSIQLFATETYGMECWIETCRYVDIEPNGIEAMLQYEDRLTINLLAHLSLRLNRPMDTLMEDLGTFLVSNAKLESVRRLLRFGGANFVDFLHSLDEVRGRARLAVPDLEVPELELFDDGQGAYRLTCQGRIPAVGHLMLGILRAMADDYGALVLLDYSGLDAEDRHCLHIDLLDSGFSAGRRFDLAVPA